MKLWGREAVPVVCFIREFVKRAKGSLTEGVILRFIPAYPLSFSVSSLSNPFNTG